MTLVVVVVVVVAVIGVVGGGSGSGVASTAEPQERRVEEERLRVQAEVGDGSFMGSIHGFLNYPPQYYPFLGFRSLN